MGQFPYPGKISEIGRQNLEAVRFKEPEQTIRFKFRYDMKPRTLLILPVGGIVKGLEPVSIEEPFNGTGSDLYLGTPTNPLAYGTYGLNNLGVALEIPNIGNGLMIPNTSAVPVIISISNSQPTAPTKGSGWGLFKWTNLNLVRKV